METRPKGKSFWIGSFAIVSARGIIRDQKVRRRAMLLLLIVAVAMLVAGSTLLHDALNPREHAGWFIAYWLGCAWLTVSALLLALFDILLVRAQARAARKAMQPTLGRTAGEQEREN